MIDELDPVIDEMKNCQIGQELVETHSEEEAQEEIQEELEKLTHCSKKKMKKKNRKNRQNMGLEEEDENSYDLLVSDIKLISLLQYHLWCFAYLSGN